MGETEKPEFKKEGAPDPAHADSENGVIPREARTPLEGLMKRLHHVTEEQEKYLRSRAEKEDQLEILGRRMKVVEIRVADEVEAETVEVREPGKLKYPTKKAREDELAARMARLVGTSSATIEADLKLAIETEREPDLVTQKQKYTNSDARDRASFVRLKDDNDYQGMRKQQIELTKKVEEDKLELEILGKKKHTAELLLHAEGLRIKQDLISAILIGGS